LVDVVWIKYYSAGVPRIARMVILAVPHRETYRGNNQQDVFCTKRDIRPHFKTLG